MIAIRLAAVAICIFAGLGALILLVWGVRKALGRLALAVRCVLGGESVQMVIKSIRSSFLEFDSYLLKQCKNPYVLGAALIILAAECLGLKGVRAHEPVRNVLSLIWTSVVPTAIVFRLAYENKNVKKLCDDIVVRWLVLFIVSLIAWGAHSDASSAITAIMGLDSSRFNSAVVATTFFEMMGAASILGAAISAVLLIVGMFFPVSASPPEALQTNGFWHRSWAGFKKNGPRFLPIVFSAMTMIPIITETILGGSNFTKVLGARIAFIYDLSDPGLCGIAIPHARILMSLDDPSRAVVYTATDLPPIPVTFLSRSQIELSKPKLVGEVACIRSKNA